MDALVPAFVVALLAEFGDSTQLLAILLARRYGRPVPVLAGIALAAVLNMALAAAGGIAAAALVDHRAIRALIGLSLLLAGGSALFRTKPAPPVESWKLGALLSSFGAFAILQFGDKTQFMAFAIAAGSGTPALAAAGAALGVVVANLPAVLLGEAWPRLVPLRAVRVATGVLLIAAGVAIDASALGIA